MRRTGYSIALYPAVEFVLERRTIDFARKAEGDFITMQARIAKRNTLAGHTQSA